MHAKLRVPLPFTWEVYGDLKAATDDCFRMFNPASAKQLEVRPRGPGGGGSWEPDGRARLHAPEEARLL